MNVINELAGDAVKQDRNRRMSVKVHLQLDFYNQLDEIAKRRGFPVATFLAVIAGEYIDNVNYDLQTRRLVALEVARKQLAVVGPSA